MIQLKDTAAIMAATPANLGAAVRIIAAGGSKLDKAQQQLASGCSKYTWQTHGREIRRMVRELEA